MTPARRTLLRGVHLLVGPQQPPRQADVWIEEGRLGDLEAASAGRAEPPLLAGFDPDLAAAAAAGTQVIDARHCWLAPPLVDPHSVLEDPCRGQAETLSSLAAAAAAGGYGTVALLPWAERRRDHPEALDLRWPEPLRLLLWGSFSSGEAENGLADHDALLRAGAVGLAAGASLLPLPLLERGLLLAEMGDRPVLLAPRDPALSQQGFVRERVEALRAGWPVDPVVSETLPLASLLALQAARPGAALRLMNVSTAEAVAQLECQESPPAASVCWWHLVADSSGLDPAAIGWRVEPSLGGPRDREALIDALERGVLSAIAVHHRPLDAEEMLLTLEQRRAGVAGHGGGAVLPALWQELVQGRRWSPHQLWQRLCWGPAAFLGLAPEELQPGSRRWILFDPRGQQPAAPLAGLRPPSLARNHPQPPAGGCGAIVASGLRGAQGWWAPGFPSS